MKRHILLGSLLVVGVLSMAAAAYQQPPAPAGPRVLDILKLKDNLYVLTSSSPTPREAFSGGNVAVFITDGGVTLVDDKLAGWGQAVLDKVKGVTDKPITRIINTHTHGDHTGNNGFFGANVEIVAQENTKTNMEKMDAFKGDGARFLPAKTYKDKMTIGSGKDRIDLYYFGAAHTNGDAFVVFRNLRVMHSGDAFSGLGTPLMDTNNGGSGLAYPETLAKAAAGIKGVDTVIPGHSAVTTWQTFVDFGEFMKSFVGSVTASAKSGQTADAAVTAFVPAEKFKAYNITRARANVDVIYKELGK